MLNVSEFCPYQGGIGRISVGFVDACSHWWRAYLSLQWRASAARARGACQLGLRGTRWHRHRFHCPHATNPSSQRSHRVKGSNVSVYRNAERCLQIQYCFTGASNS